MHVLMFGWEFPPYISGGLGTACYGLVSGLGANGVDITMIVPGKIENDERNRRRIVNAGSVDVDTYSDQYWKQMTRLKYIKVDSGLVPYTSPGGADILSTSIKQHSSGIGQATRFEFSGTYGRNLMQEVRNYALVGASVGSKLNFDVIHAHDWLTFPAGIEASIISGKPLIVHVHATEFDRSGEHINHDVFEIEKRGLEKADRVVAVSAYTKQMLIDHYGIESTKISIVHNAAMPLRDGTAPLQSQKKHDLKVVTYLGRITYQKGPEYFIDAAKKVSDEIPDAHFVMAGNGDTLLPMIERVARMRISSRFHFTGFLRSPETERLFGMSDVYVMPSVSEPFGIAPLEAAIMGVPVIISKQSGVSEILRNAIKVDYWDINALADSIISILRHKSLSDTCASNTSEDLRQITWEKAGLKVREIYNSVVKSKTL
mgnify:CR=1 FL=1